MTDLDRFPDWPTALAALPPRSGVILRDYAYAQRQALAQEMARLCRQYGHRFFVGENVALAIKLGAGFHAPARSVKTVLPPCLRGKSLAAAHDRAEIEAALAARADGIFLSPVFPTASHPGASTLGSAGFHALAHLSSVPVIALGGMTAARARDLGWPRWGAIDGLASTKAA